VSVEDQVLYAVASVGAIGFAFLLAATVSIARHGVDGNEAGCSLLAIGSMVLFGVSLAAISVSDRFLLVAIVSLVLFVVSAVSASDKERQATAAHNALEDAKTHSA